MTAPALEDDQVSRELVERLLDLPEDKRAEVVKALTADEQVGLAALLRYDLDLTLQRHQREPAGSWRWWVILAGRGAGKTFSGARWIIKKAKAGAHRWITLIAPTREAFRKIMLNGPSGILTLSPPWFMPRWEPSKLTLTWPNGVTARAYSAEKPERLRGEQHELVWADELAAWPHFESFEQIDMGLRLGADPQGLVTTTPKPRPEILDLVLGPRIGRVRVPRSDVVVVTAKSEENRFITEAVHKKLREKYGGSRFGRQEMDAELLERSGRELFTEQTIADFRVSGVPNLVRVGVGVDPTRADEPGDEAGIIAGGLGVDGEAYIFEDASLKASPLGWAAAAVECHNRYRADAIAYEKNRLGKRVEDVLRVVDPRVKWEPVVATDGKVLRAEPVSALMQQGKIHMVGTHVLLEDELTTWDPEISTWSPNRLDAFVWLVYWLMLGEYRPPLIAR